MSASSCGFKSHLRHHTIEARIAPKRASPVTRSRSFQAMVACIPRRRAPRSVCIGALSSDSEGRVASSSTSQKGSPANPPNQAMDTNQTTANSGKPHNSDAVQASTLRTPAPHTARHSPIGARAKLGRPRTAGPGQSRHSSPNRSNRCSRAPPQWRKPSAHPGRRQPPGSPRAPGAAWRGGWLPSVRDRSPTQPRGCYCGYAAGGVTLGRGWCHSRWSASVVYRRSTTFSRTLRTMLITTMVPIGK